MSEGNVDTAIDRSKFLVQERFFAERKLVEARALLERYIPEALPQEPTNIVVEHMLVGLGKYRGKFRGRHYISLGIPSEGLPYGNQELMDRYDSAGLMTMAHELIHQRHAEVVGQKAFSGIEPDTLISDEEFLKMPIADVFELAESRERDWINDKFEGIDPHADTMIGPVCEGVACLGELYLYDKRIEEAEGVNNEKLASNLRSTKRLRISELTESLRHPSRFMTIDWHSLGFKVMEGLYKKFGKENLSSLIKDIDLDACFQIRNGTPEFERIIADPSQLPGLESYHALK